MPHPASWRASSCGASTTQHFVCNGCGRPADIRYDRMPQYPEVAMSWSNDLIAEIKLQARCLLHILGYTGMFAVWVIRDPNGLRSRSGRTLIWGKIRRSAIVCVPGLAARLQRKHGLAGQCAQCGASCRLMMPCPQWDPGTHLCRIYESRPPVCRYFPMTPADLRDVELSAQGVHCGHHFESVKKSIPVQWH